MASCSLDKRRLEGIITEVLKTHVKSIEKERQEMTPKMKEGHEQKGTKNCALKEFRSHVFLE